MYFRMSLRRTTCEAVYGFPMSGDVGQGQARDVAAAAGGDVMHVAAFRSKPDGAAVDPDIQARCRRSFAARPDCR